MSVKDIRFLRSYDFVMILLLFPIYENDIRAKVSIKNRVNFNKLFDWPQLIIMGIERKTAP
jgi:hypothetical protein